MSIESFDERPYGGSRHLAFVISPPLQPLAHPTAARPLLTGPAVMPRAIALPKILVFDSGLGGLTVFREIARARPDARFVYAADDALFPYGAIEEARLVERVVALMSEFIAEHQPDLVVVACNTASTLVLPALRRHFAVPFVGTVPAIKPACASSLSKCISVLGTEATVKREYTQTLIRQFAQGCAVTLVGSGRLAGFAERELAGDPSTDRELAEEIAPCFVEDGAARTDTVVLACTHYPLLLDRLKRLAPWPVQWLDPAPAIARRVIALVGEMRGPARIASVDFVFTSGRGPPDAVLAMLEAPALPSPPNPSVVDRLTPTL